MVLVLKIAAADSAAVLLRTAGLDTVIPGTSALMSNALTAVEVKTAALTTAASTAPALTVAALTVCAPKPAALVVGFDHAAQMARALDDDVLHAAAQMDAASKIVALKAAALKNGELYTASYAVVDALGAAASTVAASMTAARELLH